jgi:NAD(P)-dependent dehydrogenase (short-subunit alcohol dehydrogenase family)
MAEPNEFAGRVAVVTGGCGAIGGAIVNALGHAGANAISLDVKQAPGIPFRQCDVRNDEAIAAAVGEIYREFGRIDIAVHAAGISRDAVVWKLSLDDWDFVHGVNLRGAFSLLRHVVPAMREGKQGGRIVLIGSINGSRGKFGTAAYSASKAGLLGLSKTVARETGRFGILINVIEPGWVRTPLTDQTPPSVREAALAESLVGSFLDPGDIAAAVLFLCGPGGKRITGQILRVDGGQFLGPI